MKLVALFFSGIRVLTLLAGLLTLLVGFWISDWGTRDGFQLPKTLVLGIGASALVVIVLIWHGLGRRRAALPLELFLIFIFSIWCFFSAWWGVSYVHAAAPLAVLASSIGWWAMGWLWGARANARLLLLAAMALGGAGVALLGLLQWALAEPGESLKAFMLIDAMKPWLPETWIAGIPRQWPWLDAIPAAIDPPGSLAGHVNIAAESCLLSLFAGMALLGSALFRSDPQEKKRCVLSRCLLGVLAVNAVALSLGFIVISGSRAAWIGTLVGLVAWISQNLIARRRVHAASGREAITVNWGRRLLQLSLVVLVMSGGLWLVDQNVRVAGRSGDRLVRPSERLLAALDTRRGTARERFALWSNSIPMFKDHWVAGVGPGNWKTAYPSYARTRDIHAGVAFSMRRQPERAHNDPLQLLCETGVVGAAFMGLFIVIAVFRLWTKGFDPRQRAARGFCACAMALLAVSFFAFPFQTAIGHHVLFLCLGIGAAGPIGRASVNRPLRFARIEMGPNAFLLAGAFALLCCVPLWLHYRGRMSADRTHWTSRKSFRSATTMPLSPGARQSILGVVGDDLGVAALRDPASLRVKILEARSYWEQGQGDRALSALEQALRIHPQSLVTMLYSAQLLQQRGAKGDFERAEKLLRWRALRIQPESAEVRFAYSQFLLARSARSSDVKKQSRWRSEAIVQLQKACQLREWFPEARVALVDLLLSEGGNVPTVVRILEEAAQNASGDPERLRSVALLSGDQRLRVVAGGIFGPTGPKTLSLWNRVLAATSGRDAEARLHLDLAPYLKSESGGNEAENSVSESQKRGLVDQLEQHLRQQPGAIQMRWHRAHLLESLERYGEARMEWANMIRYVSSGPVNPTLRNSILMAASRAADRLKDKR